MTFGRELVVLLTKLSMFAKFWCMRGGTVEVWTKNILYRFMEGQTHFSTSLKPLWSFMNRYRMFFVQTSTIPPRMHQKLSKHGKFCKQNNQLPTKSHVELKDNSTIMPPPHWLDQITNIFPLKSRWSSLGSREGTQLSQCTYKNLLWRFSSRFQLSSFHTCSIVLSTMQWHVR
jgi:hypothetical protein